MAAILDFEYLPGKEEMSEIDAIKQFASFVNILRVFFFTI